MRKWSKAQIIERLSREGLHFSEFSMTDEGNYTIDDADWNYKDIPHLHHIHQLVEAYPTLLDEELITTLNIQKVLGIRMPLSVVNYQSGKNEQTYYTTWLFFVLIVRTHYEMITPTRTRVVTTYSIGSPWLLKWVIPLIRFLIKRNYRDLMSSDIPMRQRRGELRSWGYSFRKKGESYTFPETMEILQKNVTASITQDIKLDINTVLSSDGEYFLGRSDHMGVRLIRNGNLLQVFPRMCPHEGANLDEGRCQNGQIKCPWHGRLHPAIAIFSLDETSPKVYTAEKYGIVLTFLDQVLTIQSIHTAVSYAYNSDCVAKF